MENNVIQSFLLSKGKYLPLNEIGAISAKLKSIEDETLIFKIHALSFRNPTLFTFFYWFCPLFFLIDRFFTGKFSRGVIKLFMLSMLMPTIFLAFFPFKEFSLQISTGLMISLSVLLLWIFWILFDGFTIGGRIKKCNLSKLQKVLS